MRMPGQLGPHHICFLSLFLCTHYILEPIIYCFIDCLIFFTYLVMKYLKIYFQNIVTMQALSNCSGRGEVAGTKVVKAEDVLTEAPRNHCMF